LFEFEMGIETDAVKVMKRTGITCSFQVDEFALTGHGRDARIASFKRAPATEAQRSQRRDLEGLSASVSVSSVSPWQAGVIAQPGARPARARRPCHGDAACDTDDPPFAASGRCHRGTEITEITDKKS
jgi:hypothetical protein